MHHPGGMAATHSQAIARRCWHPSGMRVVIWDVTGGVATLNHRLMAGNPFGMARYGRKDVRYNEGLALGSYSYPCPLVLLRHTPVPERA